MLYNFCEKKILLITKRVFIILAVISVISHKCQGSQINCLAYEAEHPSIFTISTDTYPNILIHLDTNTFINFITAIIHSEKSDWTFLEQDIIWSNKEIKLTDFKKIRSIQKYIHEHRSHKKPTLPNLHEDSSNIKAVFPIKNISFKLAYLSTEVWNDICSTITEGLLSLDVSYSNIPRNVLNIILSKCKELKKLNIQEWRHNHNTNEDSLSTNIIFSDNLQELYIGNTSQFNLGIENIKHLKDLSSISFFLETFASTTDWDTIIKSIPDNIENIDFSYSNYSAENTSQLKKLHRLKQITLNNCQNISSEGWGSTFENLPENLTVLTLGITNNSEREGNYNNERTFYYQGERMEQISRLKALDCLTLYNCKFNNPGTWTTLMENLNENIESLDFDSTDYSLESIARLVEFKKLKTLRIRHLSTYNPSRIKELKNALLTKLKNGDVHPVVHINSNKFQLPIKPTSPIYSIFK